MLARIRRSDGASLLVAWLAYGLAVAVLLAACVVLTWALTPASVLADGPTPPLPYDPVWYYLRDGMRAVLHVPAQDAVRGAQWLGGHEGMNYLQQYRGVDVYGLPRVGWYAQFAPAVNAPPYRVPAFLVLPAAAVGTVAWPDRFFGYPSYEALCRAGHPACQ